MMSINGGMDKEDAVHVYHGIYSAIKKNKIISFSGTWMDIETAILSEVSQTKTNI